MVVSCSFAIRTRRRMPDVRVPLPVVVERSLVSRSDPGAIRCAIPWVKLPQIKDRPARRSMPRRSKHIRRFACNSGDSARFARCPMGRSAVNRVRRGREASWALRRSDAGVTQGSATETVTAGITVMLRHLPIASASLLAWSPACRAAASATPIRPSGSASSAMWRGVARRDEEGILAPCINWGQQTERRRARLGVLLFATRSTEIVVVFGRGHGVFRHPVRT